MENELVVGLVLANWMVLTGTGAILGKHQLNISKDSEVILTGLLILSVLPLITTFLINYLKNRIFPIGAMIDVFQMFIASLFLLIPFCLLSGFLFTYISRSYSEIRMRNEIGAVYGFESAGSIAGGLLSGLIFIFLFSSVEFMRAKYHLIIKISKDDTPFCIFFLYTYLCVAWPVLYQICELQNEK